MTDGRGPEPDAAGAMRGALLIVAIGVGLGIAFNAVGLASRPRHGLAWIKATPKLESLEALQSGAHGGQAGSTPAAPPPPSSAPGTGTAEAAEPRSSGAEPRASAPPPAVASPPSGGRAMPPAPATTGASSHGAQAPPRTDRANAAAAATPPATAAAVDPAPASPPPAVATDLPVIPDVTGPLKLEIATLKKLYDANAALVVDAREAPEYAEGHIRGAVSLPYNDAMAEPERVQKLDVAGRPIVIYCSGGNCELSMDLARVLIEAGKRRVLVYEGGYPEWQSAGYPVARGPNP